MKAAVVYEAGAAPEFADFPEPDVGEGRAAVELVGAGIHNVVRSRVAGRHYSTAGTWPAVPGVDAVARTPDGRIVYTGSVELPWGTMAERMAVPAQFGLPLPDGADPLAVAAGMNPGMASWMPLVTRRDQLAESGLGAVLVLGATGVSGGLAVENAYALGAASVVAVGRDRDRLAALADRVGDEERLRTVALADDHDADARAVVDALDGRPPSIVVDFVWGGVAESAFSALGHPDLDVDGYDVGYVQIGAMAGPDASVPGALLRSRNITVSGSGLGGTPVSEILARLPEFMRQIAAGDVHVPYTAYPLSRVADAWSADDGTRAVVVPG